MAIMATTTTTTEWEVVRGLITIRTITRTTRIEVPETMDKTVEVIEALVTTDPQDSKGTSKDMTRIRTNNLCSQLSRCSQCLTR
jgi:hypothetical protein